MSWLDQGGTFVLASVVLFVPGAAAALTLRLRGFTVLAVAAPLSLAILAAAGLMNVVVPFRWNAAAWVVSAVLLVVAAFAVRVVIARAIRRGSISAPERTGRGGWTEAVPFIVLGVVAILSGARLAAAFGAPSHISQTFDNIYHLNAVRQMMDDGVIAPTRQLLPGFYPDLWHIVVSTVSQLSGAGVAESVNVVSIVLGAVVWPVSCIWLTRTVVGAHMGATIAAGALAVGMTAFPLLMLDFGVLYPNVLSIALLPSAIAAVVLVTGVGRGDRPDPIVRWVLLIAVVPTMALAHPSTLMAFFLPAFLLAFTGLALWWRSEVVAQRARARRGWSFVAVLGAFLLAVTLFVVARPTPELAFWPPSATVQVALTHVVSGGLVWRPAACIVSVIAAIGVLTIVIVRRWRRQWWLVGSVLGLIVLYIVCVSFPMSGFRYGLTGTWYQDVYRIAALFPAIVVPLGAMGVVGIAGVASAALSRGASGVGRVVPVALGALVAVALLVVTQTGEAMAVETRNTAAVYRQGPDSPLVTDDERALLERLPDTVPADETIVGNPWTGTSLSFALADRRALIPHIFQELSPDMRMITERLDQAGSDPAVCAALTRTSTRWVLDFGTAEIHGGDHAYPGLSDIGAVARLVDQVGDARLYEITACD
ncbi:DUF6541 family protein [Microbacterium sp. NPDC089695]|uniref:DUF6541 family protein n=1 Tax=Microbacterium sp. NPDC089695 TaxID=3364198 RepID=UPI00382661D4